MKSAALLLVVTGLLLSGSPAPSAVVRAPTLDGQWLARIGGTMTRRSTGSAEPYVRMGYVTVKGATVSQFLTGRVNLATGVTPLRCVMNLGASGVWSVTATVTLTLSSRG